MEPPAEMPPTEQRTPADLPRLPLPLEAEVFRLLVRWAMTILRGKGPR